MMTIYDENEEVVLQFSDSNAERYMSLLDKRPGWILVWEKDEQE